LKPVNGIILDFWHEHGLRRIISAVE
jgi:hypothetical protein